MARGLFAYFKTWTNGGGDPGSHTKAEASPGGLKQLPCPGNVNYSDLRSLAGLHHDPDFKALADTLAENPRSLLPPNAQAHLYTAIRTIQPKNVIEIGTFMAGTSESMARAVFENGRGHLHTVAPHLGDQVRANIAGWEEPLQRHATFYEMSSADFFAQFAEAGHKVGVALIDGNHDYEFALFDLLMTGRCAEPDALVFMDNISQPGVYWAVRHFLQHHPGWEQFAITTAPDGPNQLFDRGRTSLYGTDFGILKAPSHHVVAPGLLFQPGSHRTSLSVASSLRLQIKDCNAPVRFHANVILRAVTSQDREELSAQAIGIILPGVADQTFHLEPQLRSLVPDPAVRLVEVVMVLGSGEKEPLFLSAEPEVL